MTSPRPPALSQKMTYFIELKVFRHDLFLLHPDIKFIFVLSQPFSPPFLEKKSDYGLSFQRPIFPSVPLIYQYLLLSPPAQDTCSVASDPSPPTLHCHLGLRLRPQMLKHLKLFPLHEITKYLSHYDSSYSLCYHNTRFCFFYFSNACAFIGWLLNTLQDCILRFFSISTISILISFVLTAMLITSKYQ